MRSASSCVAGYVALLGRERAVVGQDRGGGPTVFAANNVPASSTLTQKWLGWWPSRPGLLADLDQTHDSKI